MKKLLFLFLLFTGIASAQGVQNIKGTYGSGPPQSTNCPGDIGTHYVDTAASQVYAITAISQQSSGTTCTWTAVSTSSSSSTGTVSPLSFGAKFDVLFSGNCSWTGAASTTSITCAGGDIAFAASDVGKICFGTTGATQINNTLVTAGGLTLPACTITAFTSATQVTVTYTGSSTTCTPSSSIACTFAYGTQDDTTAIQSAQTAAWATPGSKCALELPAGAAFVSKSLFNIAQTNQCMGSTPNSGVLADVTSRGPVVYGKAQGAVILIPLPSFDFTTCNTGDSGKGCFGTTQNLHAHDFSIDGLQQRLTAANNVNFWESVGGAGGGVCDGGVTVWNMAFSGWGLTSTNSTGFQWGSDMCNDSTLWNVNVSAFGATPCSIVGAGNILSVNALMCFGSTNSNLRLALTNSAIFNSTNSQYISTYGASTAVITTSGTGTGQFNSIGDLISAGINNTSPTQQSAIINNGGNLNATFIRATIAIPVGTTSTSQIFFMNSASAGSIHFRDSTITGTGTNNRFASLSANDKLYNDGGNKISLGSVASVIPAGTYISNRVTNGACTGVVTASLTTGGIYGTGPNIAATACNAAPNNAAPGALGVGIPMQGAGNLQGLLVSASAAGTNASSGVVTVMKNGVATTLTCTIGTGTVCNDFTHTAAFIAGDLISFQYTSQAADTLAGLKISVDLNN